jgi:Zn-dependent protease with chaperone function
MFLECCDILDIQQEPPELFISQNPFLNAGAVGMDRPFITLNSALVQSLDDEELMCVIGHELGHVLSGHVLYKTLLALMLQFSTFLMNIPLSGLTIAGLIAALKEWDRKSELSADRAGLLTIQNPEVSVSLLMKMAGGNQTDEMNLGEFIKQAEEYDQSEGLMDNVYKLLNLMTQTHPFPVLRVNEVLKWVQKGDYENILSRNYDAGAGSIGDDFKEASQDYAEGFRESFGPTVQNAGQKAREIFETFFNQGR